MHDPAELRRLADALDESATEVQSFPHPSHCEHLHVAHKVMRESAAVLRSLAEVQPIPEQPDAKDALRYRWLADRVVVLDESTPEMMVITVVRDAYPGGGFLDASVDAAIAAMKEPT